MSVYEFFFAYPWRNAEEEVPKLSCSITLRRVDCTCVYFPVFVLSHSVVSGQHRPTSGLAKSRGARPAALLHYELDPYYGSDRSE